VRRYAPLGRELDPRREAELAKSLSRELVVRPVLRRITVKDAGSEAALEELA
jgi:hypothetical protein